MRLHTFKYAIVNNGNNVNGTKYNKAGWAALNTSELTVAVNKPRKYLKVNEQKLINGIHHNLIKIN